MTLAPIRADRYSVRPDKYLARVVGVATPQGPQTHVFTDDNVIDCRNATLAIRKLMAGRVCEPGRRVPAQDD